MVNHLEGRSTLRRHNRQLVSYRKGKFLGTIAKSIFGLIDVYNLLPQAIIDTRDVHTFQAKLQEMLKELATRKRPEWEILFSPRHALHLHPLAKLMQCVATIGGDEYVTVTTPGPSQQPIAMDMIEADIPPAWW